MKQTEAVKEKLVNLIRMFTVYSRFKPPKMEWAKSGIYVYYQFNR